MKAPRSLPARRAMAVAIALPFLLLSLPLAANAAETTTATATEKLTPAELEERAARKGCKVKICSAFRLKQPGEDVACHVEKSWRETQLTRMVSKAGVSWPWGAVKCMSDIKLPRDQMIKAMDEASFKLKLEEHTVSCTVAREKEPAKISFAFAPEVTFEKGKAVKAQLNWGKIDAPTLVKGAMWTATATDNTFNVLQSTIVEDINDFLTAKCDEVKAELK